MSKDMLNKLLAGSKGAGSGVAALAAAGALAYGAFQSLFTGLSFPISPLHVALSSGSRSPRGDVQPHRGDGLGRVQRRPAHAHPLVPIPDRVRHPCSPVSTALAHWQQGLANGAHGLACAVPAGCESPCADLSHARTELGRAGAPFHLQ